MLWNIQIKSIDSHSKLAATLSPLCQLYHHDIGPITLNQNEIVNFLVSNESLDAEN